MRLDDIIVIRPLQIYSHDFIATNFIIFSIIIKTFPTIFSALNSPEDKAFFSLYFGGQTNSHCSILACFYIVVAQAIGKRTKVFMKRTNVLAHCYRYIDFQVV